MPNSADVKFHELRLCQHMPNSTTRKAVAFCISMFVATAFAQAPASQFFDFTFPKGWAVQTERDGSATASPSADAYDRSVSVQYCHRLTRADCHPGCDTLDMRARYLVTTGQPNAQYFERKRLDGYMELRESSNYSGSSDWVANAVVCSEVGIVIVGATSANSRKEAVALVSGVLETLRWRSSQALPTPP